jgi:hypothetical protein
MMQRGAVCLEFSTFCHWVAEVGQAGAFACRPALEQGYCPAEQTNPAETGFRSM